MKAVDENALLVGYNKIIKIAGTKNERNNLHQH